MAAALTRRIGGWCDGLLQLDVQIAELTPGDFRDHHQATGPRRPPTAITANAAASRWRGADREDIRRSRSILMDKDTSVTIIAMVSPKLAS